MQHNVGKADRAIRIIVGLVIIAAGFYYQSWWGAIGIIPLFTGALRWCPPYQLLGISTDKK
jgi:sulfite exporter TauE/SafE